MFVFRGFTERRRADVDAVRGDDAADARGDCHGYRMLPIHPIHSVRVCVLTIPAREINIPAWDIKNPV